MANAPSDVYLGCISGVRDALLVTTGGCAVSGGDDVIGGAVWRRGLGDGVVIGGVGRTYRFLGSTFCLIGRLARW
jgi:hypothetical protein